MNRQYKAFISYSWADKDWGTWLHRALELYRTPRPLVGVQTPLGPVPQRLHPIFKDREEEAAGHGIAASIEKAMDASEFLIVICSPRSAQSKWVNREVAWFKSHKSKERILALVVDGEPGASLSTDSTAEECFPATLLYEVDENLQPTAVLEDVPLAADAREEGDGKKLAKLKLAAALLGLGLDDLVRRDERRATVRRRIVLGASLGLSVVMTALLILAIQARNEALKQRTEAEGLVEYMISDLRGKLQQEVQLKVLVDIAARAEQYYVNQSDFGMDADALGRRSRVLTFLGDLKVDLGESSAAMVLFQEAAAASGKLLQGDNRNPQRILEHAHNIQSTGQLAFHLGDLTEAEKQMREAVALTGRLTSLDETNQEWLAEKGSALANLGIIQLKNRQLVASTENLQLAAKIKRATLDSAHDEWQARSDLSATLSWLAEAYVMNGDQAESMNILAEEDVVYTAMLTANPDDELAKSMRLHNRIKYADALLKSGETDRSLRQARTAVVNAEEILAKDPSNTYNLTYALKAYLVLGEGNLSQDRPSEALSAAIRAEELANELVSLDAARPDWSGQLLGQTRLLGLRAAAYAATDEASCLQSLEPATEEAERLTALATANDADLALTVTAAQAEMLRGDVLFKTQQIDAAHSAWTGALHLLTPLGRNKPRDLASLQLISQLEQRIENPTTSICRQFIALE